MLMILQIYFSNQEFYLLVKHLVRVKFTKILDKKIIFLIEFTGHIFIALVGFTVSLKCEYLVERYNDSIILELHLRLFLSLLQS